MATSKTSKKQTTSAVKEPGKGSKRYKAAIKTVDLQKTYSLNEAIELAKTNATAKFDETIELALKLGVDPRHSDQMVRGVVPMPNGTGKKVAVAVFAKGDKAEEAKKAGAEVVGAEDLVEQIKKGEINFDRCIASPDMMTLVSAVAKVLGPKGLMPNPKLGTVTPNVGEAVKAAKSGQVEFRVEKAGIIHAGFGKASFDSKALQENILALVSAILKAKPTGAKGSYLRGAYISSAMGPSYKVDIASLMQS